MRKVARETAFKLIYEYLFQGEEQDLTCSDIIEMSLSSLDEKDLEYISRIYRGVIAEKDGLTETLAKYAVGYQPARIYKIDLAILLLAIYEILRCEDIPASVSINEAVELAKIYSTEKSGGFINGVLGAVEKSKREVAECPQQS